MIPLDEDGNEQSWADEEVIAAYVKPMADYLKAKFERDAKEQLEPPK